MQKSVRFPSGPYQLAGILHVPDDIATTGPRPAIIALHGFGGNKDGPTHIGECGLYESLGYVSLRIDMRGCGESEGPPGHIICMEQVEDVRNAVTWLAAQKEVRPDAIVVTGQSFGGAVAIYAGAVDERIAGVISIGGWGNGARKLEWQNRAPGAWDRLLGLMEKGRRLREETGDTLMVKRWDVVPVPEPIRHLLPPGCIMDFPVDTPQSIYDFRPEDVITRIAPRPFLIIHGANDSVTSTSEALSIFQAAAGEPELAIFKGDHFPFTQPDPMLEGIMANWLARCFNAPAAH